MSEYPLTELRQDERIPDDETKLDKKVEYNVDQHIKVERRTTCGIVP